MTLTPEDGEAILRECPAVRARRPDRHAQRRRSSTATRTGSPSSINGTTPAYLDVRDWPDRRGRAVHRQRRPPARKVCLLGQTVVRELFGDESPIGKEIRVNNVASRVVGVLAPQGREHDGPRPGRRRARPVDDDQVPRLRRRPAQPSATGNAGAAAGERQRSTRCTARTRPARPQLYPAPSATQQAEHPDARAVHQHRPDHLRPPISAEQIAAGDRADHRGAPRAAPHPAPASPTTSSIRDMTEMIERADAARPTLMTSLLLSSPASRWWSAASGS